MNMVDAVKNQLLQYSIIDRKDGFFLDHESIDLTPISFEANVSGVIFPTREGEFIEDISLIPAAREYALSYPGTASMKNVVLFNNDGGGLFIGGIPSYEFTKIRIRRVEDGRVRITYNSTNHKLYFITFKDHWHEAADTYKELCHVKDEAVIKNDPKFFLQIGIKDSDGKTNISHFNEIKPVIDRAYDALGDRLIIHFFGTNTGGFDRMLPDYSITKELGGKEGLSDLISYIHDKGLLTSHHFNPRIADASWIEQHPEYIPAIVLYKDNLPVVEPYKERENFIMNPNNKRWFAKCMEQAKYLHDIGFDYVQLDQFTYQRNFFNKTKPLQHGYKRMTEEFDALGIKYWLEGVSDIFKVYNDNFYQILTRDRHQLWDDCENRRGYPHGTSLPEYFMYFYPNSRVSIQLITENNDLSNFPQRLEIARKINAAIYDLQMTFYGKDYDKLLDTVLKKIKKYEA